MPTPFPSDAPREPRSRQAILFRLPRLAALALIAGGIATMTSCARHEYEVRLEPTESGLSRQIDLRSRTDDDDAKAEAKRFAAIYGKGEQLPDRESGGTLRFGDRPPIRTTEKGGVRFRGQVGTDTNPADIGGSSVAWKQNSALGSGGFYMERLRGRLSVGRSMELRLRAATDAAKLLRHLLEPNMNVGNAKLDVFQSTLESDLQAIAVHVTAMELRSPVDVEAEQEGLQLGAFLLQRLMERGVITAKEGFDISSKRGKGLSDVVATRIFRRMLGGSQAALDSIKLLMDEEQPREQRLALAARALESEELRSLVQGWEAVGKALERRHESELIRIESLICSGGLPKLADSERGGDAVDRIGKAAGAIAEYLIGGSPYFPLGKFDSATFALALPEKPIVTNGRWIEEERVVRWASRLATRKSRTASPVVLHATWVTPDEAMQRSIFGETRLRGKQLLRVLHWEAALPAIAAQSWQDWLRQEIAPEMRKVSYDTMLSAWRKRAEAREFELPEDFSGCEEFEEALDK